MTGTPQTLIIIGLLLASIGVLFFIGNKFLNLGNLPGDIKFQKGNFRFYFPIASSIIISLIISLAYYLLTR